MNAPSHKLFGTITSHVETYQKVVALTFDDGPTKNVSAILSLLDDYNTKATFFKLGRKLRKI